MKECRRPPYLAIVIKNLRLRILISSDSFPVGYLEVAVIPFPLDIRYPSNVPVDDRCNCD